MKSIRTTLIMCMLLPIALAFAMLGGTLIVYMNNISVEKEMNEVVVSSTKDINGLVASYIRYDPSLTYGTSGTFYTDADGDGKLEEVTPTDLSVYDKTDKEHVGWFYTPLENKKATWMEPYFNANINKTIISYVSPVYLKSGADFAVIGVDFDFAYLDKLLKAHQK